MMFQQGAPRRVALLGLVLAVCAFGCGPPDYDLIIQGGTVFDGTGTPGVVTDLAIKGERIAAIGDVGGNAERTIDATGLYVAPGFVDMHSHSELRRLLDGGQGPSFAFQGLTTEVYGETTSMGPRGGRIEGSLPEELEGKWETLGGFFDYLDETGIAINVASYVGSGSVRAYVMGYEDREPTGEELEQMLGLVRDAMAEGAFGVSAGLSYVPNIYMSTEELAAIVAEAAAVGGIFANHARTMNGTDPEAITEALLIGERAGAPVHFFHLNSTSSTEADTFLGLIDEARTRGMQVTGDSYTYTWGITGLRSYIPAWAQEGGVEAMLERLRDPEVRERIAGDFVTEPPYLANIGWHRVRLGVDDPEINGKLVEGWDTIGDVSITACSLTAAQRAGSVSSVSSNTDAIDASFELSSSSLSDTTSTFSGTVRLRSLEDDNAAEETVTVTFYLGKDTANEVTLGSESYTTYDND